MSKRNKRPGGKTKKQERDGGFATKGRVPNVREDGEYRERNSDTGKENTGRTVSQGGESPALIGKSTDREYCCRKEKQRSEGGGGMGGGGPHFPQEAREKKGLKEKLTLG